MASTDQEGAVASGTRSALRYGALVAAALVAAGLAGYAAIFNTLVSSDEGYMLLSIDQTLSGRPLYDEVFSHYGPAYFALMGGVFRLPGVELGHDAGRLMHLGLWTASSLLCGASVLRLTGNFPAALTTLTVSFYVLSANVNEPMHPGALLMFLLAGIIASAVFLVPSRPRAAMLVIGALAATAALTKINIGIFAFAAIGFACATTMAPDRLRRTLHVAATVLLVVLPFALMKQNLGEGWALEFGLVVALAAVAVSLAAWPLPGGISPRSLVGLAAGIGAAAGIALAAALLGGTTPGGLIDGVITTPLAQDDLFTSETSLYLISPFLAAAGVAAAAAATWSRNGLAAPGSLRPWAIPGLRIAAGLAIWVCALRVGGVDPTVTGFGHDWNPESLGLVAPLAWIAVAAPGARTIAPAESFARILIATLAVAQLLHPYPVPGTQIAWGIYLFAVVGGICVADGVRELRPLLAARHLELFANGAVLAFLALVIALPFSGWAAKARSDYSAHTPLDLPGAHRLHLPQAQVDELRAVTADLRTECSTVLTYPGFDSLNLLSGVDPPTGMNNPVWTTIYESDEQSEILAALRSHKGYCVVREPVGPTGLGAELIISDPELAQRPLVSFIENRLTVTSSYPTFEILQAPGASR